MAKQQPTLPDGIEIFRAGRRTADNGKTYEITAADIAAAAAAYDPTLHEAPLTVGHPASNLPAYGWVGALRADGDVLRVASHRQVEPQFAEMVQSGRFKKRSASFYAPTDPANPKPGTWYVRHVAYLGAQPPAVKGLKDIEFSEAADAVNFSEPIEPIEQEHQDMSKELQEQLDEANRKLEAERAARIAAEGKATAAESAVANFQEGERVRRHTANVSFCEAAVKSGRLLPKDQTAAVAVLDVLDAVDAIEFSEGNATVKVSPAAFVQKLIEGSGAKVEFGEFRPGSGGAELAEKGDSDAEIDAKARAYAAQHNVSYSEAITKVTASFTA